MISQESWYFLRQFCGKQNDAPFRWLHHVALLSEAAIMSLTVNLFEIMEQEQAENLEIPCYLQHLLWF